jgi:hypothetical protein
MRGLLSWAMHHTWSLRLLQHNASPGVVSDYRVKRIQPYKFHIFPSHFTTFRTSTSTVVTELCREISNEMDGRLHACPASRRDKVRQHRQSHTLINIHAPYDMSRYPFCLAYSSLPPQPPPQPPFHFSHRLGFWISPSVCS